MNAKYRSVFNHWRDRNSNEMRLFFHMRIIQKPNVNLYWNRQHILSTSMLISLIKRVRNKFLE